MRFLSAMCMLLAMANTLAAEVTPVDKVQHYVNIRSAPDAGADVVGRLGRGETLPSPDTVDGWFRVELPDGGIGYVHSDWAVIVADAEVAGVDDAGHGTKDVDEDAAAAPEAPADEAASGIADVTPEPDAESSPVEPAIDEPGDAEDTIVAAEPVPDEPQPEPAGADGGEIEAQPPVAELRPADSPPAPVSPIKGQRDFVVRFRTETTGTSSQIYDNGNVVGIGTTAPQQRLEVNGSIQIHDQNSGVAGLMITQSSGDTGYILHNRASTLTIGAGSVDRITIDRAGNIGIAVARPEHPLHVANGAFLSAGGVWTNSSSRQDKTDIHALDTGEAISAVMALQPVSFRYRKDAGESYLGFIAEDVPDLVATADRSGLSAMDIVAALTKVIQEQERRIAALEKTLADVGK
ncbi:MAG: tail fiber domain-containing protein [Woeseiaceae bacterium]|nr:tail fiber domain-containing protein [Woeseiaceae bacterium]